MKNSLNLDLFGRPYEVNLNNSKKVFLESKIYQRHSTVLLFATIKPQINYYFKDISQSKVTLYQCLKTIPGPGGGGGG